MSWRALTVFLLLATVASVQGGIQLGEYLISRAPDSIAASSRPRESNDQLLDADGKPFTAQPPQPRVDGTLGSPREHAAINWHINPSLANPLNNKSNAIKVPTETHTRPEQTEDDLEKMDPDLFAAEKNLTGGQNDVATLDIANPKQNSSVSGGRIYPSKEDTFANSTPPAIASEPRPAPLSWQQNFKSELDQCASQGFFQRPSCIQNTRNRHCASNQAWGNHPDCPARTSEFSAGG
jgi:hypothetical protein